MSHNAHNLMKHHYFIVLVLCITLFFGCKKKSDPEPTRETSTVTDREGNVYGTIKIGDQWWMTENLRVRVYNDSTPISEVKSSDSDSVWAMNSTGAFCEVENRYGLHYNWFAISNSKKLAPAGWHIPTDDDWKTLERELGMSRPEVDKTSWRGVNESEKLIPESSIGWPKPSPVFGTNESGFSALPGGCRLFNGAYGEVSATAYWWSSTINTSSTAWYRNLSTSNKKIFRYYVDKNYGLTVRCVKN